MANTASEIIAFMVSISGWVLVSSTLPTDYWKVSTIDGTVITTATYWANLWKTCVTDSTGVSNCKDFPSMLALDGLHPLGPRVPALAPAPPGSRPPSWPRDPGQHPPGRTPPRPSPVFAPRARGSRGEPGRPARTRAPRGRLSLHPGTGEGDTHTDLAEGATQALGVEGAPLQT